MAWSYLGGSGGTWALEPAFQVTVSTPTVAVGDLLLYFSGTTRNGGSYDGFAHALDSPVTGAPSGWTYFTETNNTQQAWGIEVYYRVADGTESGSYVFTYSSANNQVQGSIVAYRGLKTSSMGTILNERDAEYCYTFDAPAFKNAGYFDATTTNASTDLYLAVAMCLGYTNATESTPTGLTKRLATHEAPISGLVGWTGSGMMVYDKTGQGTGYSFGYTVDDGSSLGSSVGATIVLGLVAIPPSSGVSHGTSTALAVGNALKPAVGASAGTSTAIAYAGVFGKAAGTSTAAGVGKSTVASAGTAAGVGGATSFTGIRTAVGAAAGTSTASSTLPLAASRVTTVNHATNALTRLCAYAREVSS